MPETEFSHPDRIVLVITALSEERKSILPFLRKDSVTAKSDQYRREYITGDYFSGDDTRPWHILLPAPTSAGNAKSAAETALSLSLNPAFVFLLGVAGGFPNKVNMYDVVVADRVYDVDAAKIDAEGSYIPRPDQHKATSVLLSRAKTLQDLGGWQMLLTPDLPNEEIEVWIEPIAAGSKLVASSKSEEFDRIKRDAPRAVAVENEGFGVLQAAHEAAAAALVVRGISDLIDNRPIDRQAENANSGTGRIGPDPHKLKASRHAAAFMFALLGRLSTSDIDEVVKEEDQWVDVSLRWEDLKELAKGKRLALQILDGSPVRNLRAKLGSVEVVFKTIRLVSAFIYALSLEKRLIRKMVGLPPDKVDTQINTSDPDVTRIFSAVRKLGSTDQWERQQGEKELQTLVEVHQSLKALTNKAVIASRKAAISENKDELRGDRRITFRLSSGFAGHLHDLAVTNNTSLNTVISKLLRGAAKAVSEKAPDLSAFIVEPSKSGTRVNAILPSTLVDELMDYGEDYGITSQSQLLSTLIGYATEMRLTDLYEIKTSQLHDSHVAFREKALQSLLREAGVSLTELARSADISVSTLSRARYGAPIRRSTAVKILSALESEIGKHLDTSDFLRET